MQIVVWIICRALGSQVAVDAHKGDHIVLLKKYLRFGGAASPAVHARPNAGPVNIIRADARALGCRKSFGNGDIYV